MIPVKLLKFIQLFISDDILSQFKRYNLLNLRTIDFKVYVSPFSM